jgi:hypothetical protein
MSAWHWGWIAACLVVGLAVFIYNRVSPIGDPNYRWIRLFSGVIAYGGWIVLTVSGFWLPWAWAYVLVFNLAVAATIGQAQTYRSD